MSKSFVSQTCQFAATFEYTKRTIRNLVSLSSADGTVMRTVRATGLFRSHPISAKSWWLTSWLTRYDGRYA